MEETDKNATNLKRKIDSRFGEYSDDELEEERNKLKRKNTLKSDKKTEKVFVQYLTERWLPTGEIENTEYRNYSEELLDKILCKYWFEVRQVNSDMYNINSMRSLRYSLNRNLKRRGKKFDLTKSDCFTKNQEAFDDACRKLKLLGYGHVKHYEEIKPKGEKCLNLSYLSAKI